MAACPAIAGRNRSRSDPTAGRFTHAQVGDIVDGAFTRFEQRVPDLPSEPTLGSRQNVMLATLTLCFLEALAADSQIVLVACSPAELPTPLFLFPAGRPSSKPAANRPTEHTIDWKPAQRAVSFNVPAR